MCCSMGSYAQTAVYGKTSADQLIFVDESAANERAENRKFGWTLRGITPHKYRLFKHSER